MKQAILQDAASRLASELCHRARIGEQAFQVEHYLALWKTHPTADNWRRVIDAAEAYSPIGGRDDESAELRRRLVAGERVYYAWKLSGGTATRVRLCRYSRIGTRGKVYAQSFRKGSKRWTRES